MDAATATVVVSAAVAIAGTFVTWANRNKDTSDKRLDLVFSANQALVDDLRQERGELLQRIVVLEHARTLTDHEMSKLREDIVDQAMDMRVLRQREAELRLWATEIMAWSLQAVQMIRSLGGVVDDPPYPPSDRSLTVDLGFARRHTEPDPNTVEQEGRRT